MNYFKKNNYVKIHSDEINSIFVPNAIWEQTDKKTDIYSLDDVYYSLNEITDKGFEILGEN